MRVIAGSARKMRLKAPRGNDIRPTADQVKEALFSIIGNRVVGAIFLDLFAGSGAIGIEALSRGAGKAIFVDSSRQSILLIKENLSRTGFSEKASVLESDALQAIKGLSIKKIKADLIYLDPPYAEKLNTLVIDKIIEHAIIANNGLIIVEHAYDDQDWAQPYPVIKQKKYGRKGLTIIPFP